MKKKFLTWITIVVLVFSLYLIWENFYKDTPQVSDYNQLKVHYIDVGQGDSCFIELPNGENMLIDGGESKYADDVSKYISALSYSKIDYLVATHGDSDHIGSLYKIFEDFDVENCYTSFYGAESKTYERFCEAVENEGIDLNTPYANEFIIDTENLDIEVLGPIKNQRYKDKNDASVVLMISYYDKDFLFTGDASYGWLEDYNIGDIEVLKVSHHGSYTGTSKELINEIRPEYSVISVGQNNRYNHPHDSVIRLLRNSTVYETSKKGCIIASCDKNSINFEFEKAN